MTTPGSDSASAPIQKSQSYRPDIDGLRAIAVLAVLGYHAFPARVRGGFVGVDVFFVISGFLITGILMRGLDRGSFSFRGFYSRRIRRIFPALFVILAACFICGWFVLLPKEYALLGKHTASGAGFVSNLTLWWEAGYFDPAAETKPLLHLWSLGIEEQFYIVWPLLLWALWKTRFNVLILLGALTVLSFWLNLHRVHTDAVAAFYSPVTRWWELMIGSCLARLSVRPRASFPSGPRWLKLHNVQSALGLACICAGILLIKPDYVFPGWWALLPVIGTFLVIAAGPEAWFNRILLAHPILVWVGLISYPLYLWHWPLLFFVRQMGTGAPGIKVRIAVLIASVVLAYLTYLVVERRIRFGKPGKKVLISCLGMATIGVVGWVTYAQHGLAFRCPAAVRSLLTYSYNPTADARVHECWVGNSTTYEEFASSCVDRSAKDSSVVLWGDSHAARLYPGLHNVLQQKLAISEFARDHCPPVIGYGTPICIRGNAYVVERIKELHPQSVIMFGDWASHRTGLDMGEYTSQHLVATVEELRQLGVQNIVVIGPPPIWRPDLPTVLARHAMKDAPFYRIPDRMWDNLDPNAIKVDERVRAMLQHEPSVHYVSLIERLCTSDGCLTRVPQSPADLMTWDYGHFTTPGAELVAHYLLEKKVL
jgi:peptidoglycan/LPS O-acetylase OafA/YrhL